MIQKFKEVNPTTPTVGAALNKVRRCWYKYLPETAGLVARDILNKYNLNISGWNDESVSGWREFTGRPGQFGYAAFDGVDDAAIGPIGSTLTNTYTIAATVFVPNNNIRGCMLRVGDSTQGCGFGIGNTDMDSTGNNLLVAVESVRWITAKTALGTGWFRIAMAVNSTGGFTVYVNGVQVLSEASGTGPNTPSSFSMYIGGYTAGAGGTFPRYFKGFIDNVTLYTKVLSGAEFKEDWKQEQQGFPNMINWRPLRRPFAILAPAAVATTPVGISGDASWDVHELPKTPVGTSGDATWDLRGKVGIAASAVWDTLAPPLPAGTIYNDTFSTPYDFTGGGGSVAGWTITDGVWANPAGIVTQSDDVGSGFDKKLIHDGITFPQNIDITAKIRVDKWVPSGDARLGLIIGSDYSGSGVNFLFHSNQLTFMKNGVGWGTSAVAFTPVVSTWYRMRLRQDMNAGQYGEFQGKVWADADPEPLDWTLIESARGWGAADGSPGLMGGSTNTATASFDDFIAADPSLMDPFTAAVGLTGSASWDVAPPSAATTPVGISGSASWDVRYLSGTYMYTLWDVHTLATVSGSASWDVATIAPTAPIGIGATATWDIVKAIGFESVCMWNVRQTADAAGSLAWDLRTPAGISGALAWDVAAAPNVVGLYASAVWDIDQNISVNASCAWNNHQNVGINGYDAWDLSGSIGMVGIAAWGLAEPIGMVGIAVWDNLIPVNREFLAVWDVRQTAGLANGMAWAVRTPSRIAANALWGVRLTIGGSYADRWHNRVGAGLERSADWSLRELVSQTGSASWDITTLLPRWPVGILGMASWADRRIVRLDAWAGWRDCVPVNLTRTMLFNIHINKGINSSIAFNTRARVGTPAVATWGLRAGIGLTGTTSWTTRARVGRSGAGTWDRRARVGLSNGLSWNIRTFMGMSLSGTWRNLARVATAGACVWDQRARVGSNLVTSWNILNGVYVSGSASWGLRAIAGVSGDIGFTTFRATVADPEAFDPAEAVAYLAAQHGAGTWGSIPGPGSVRIDHDYPTADAMRAARGDDGIPGVSIRIFNMNDYVEGFRSDPGDVLGRSLTGADGRWLNDIFLIPGEYIILYEEEGRFPVADYLAVAATPGREPPDMPPGDPSSLYYEMDYLLSIHHGWGAWGGAEIRGPSPVDHSYGGIDRYQLTRYGVGLAGVMLEIFPEADYLAGRRSERYRLGWSRTNAVGRWDWPVNLYPGRYIAVGWREGVAHTFIIEVS